jgi:hypothetical protein
MATPATPPPSDESPPPPRTSTLDRPLPRLLQWTAAAFFAWRADSRSGIHHPAAADPGRGISTQRQSPACSGEPSHLSRPPARRTLARRRHSGAIPADPSAASCASRKPASGSCRACARHPPPRHRASGSPPQSEPVRSPDRRRRPLGPSLSPQAGNPNTDRAVQVDAPLPSLSNPTPPRHVRPKNGPIRSPRAGGGRRCAYGTSRSTPPRPSSRGAGSAR